MTCPVPFSGCAAPVNARVVAALEPVSVMLALLRTSPFLMFSVAPLRMVTLEFNATVSSVPPAALTINCAPPLKPSVPLMIAPPANVSVGAWRGRIVKLCSACSRAGITSPPWNRRKASN